MAHAITYDITGAQKEEMFSSTWDSGKGLQGAAEF